METEAGLLIWCDLSFSSMLAANNGAPFSHSSLSAATDLFVSHCAATYQAHVWNESPFSGHDYCFLQNPSFERVRIGIKSLAALSSLQMSYIFCICMVLPSRHLTEISLMLVSHPHCSFFSVPLFLFGLSLRWIISWPLTFQLNPIQNHNSKSSLNSLLKHWGPDKVQTSHPKKIFTQNENTHTWGHMHRCID